MVFAEKIVTAIDRGEGNTRWRDFADVYALTRLHQIDADELRVAMETVAEYRRVTLTPLLTFLRDSRTCLSVRRQSGGSGVLECIVSTSCRSHSTRCSRPSHVSQIPRLHRRRPGGGILLLGRGLIAGVRGRPAPAPRDRPAGRRRLLYPRMPVSIDRFRSSTRRIHVWWICHRLGAAR